MTDEQKTKIATQVRDVIEQWLATGGKVEVNLVVGAVVGSWSPPGGDDADNWLICGYEAVRGIARTVVRKYEPDAEADMQDMLPGFEGVHRAYIIPDGERKGTIVRAELMTVAEALSVITQLDRNITGLSIHKNNLLRFIDEVLIPRGNGN